MSNQIETLSLIVRALTGDRHGNETLAHNTCVQNGLIRDDGTVNRNRVRDLLRKDNGRSIRRMPGMGDSTFRYLMSRMLED